MRIRCSNCEKIYNENKKECPRCGRDNSLSPDYVDSAIEIDVNLIKDDIKKKINSIEADNHMIKEETYIEYKAIDGKKESEFGKKLNILFERINGKAERIMKKLFNDGYCEFCGEQMYSSTYSCPKCKRSNNGVKNLDKKHDPNHFINIHKDFLLKNSGVIDRNRYLKMLNYEGFDFEKWNSNYTYKTGNKMDVLVAELIWTFGFILIVATTINSDGSAFENPATWIILLIGNILAPFISRHIFERYICFTMKNIDYVRSSRNEGENYSITADELEEIELVLYNNYFAENIIFTSKKEAHKNYVVFSLPTITYYKNDELAIFVLMFCMKHNLKLTISKGETEDLNQSAEDNNIISSEGYLADTEKIKGTINEKGYVHVYTGNGKGKTTSAFGVALRSVCSGKRVYIGQFVKDMKYSETKITEKYNNIVIEQLGAGCFIEKEPTEIDIEIATNALIRCSAILKSGDYDLVILDEITIAIIYKLIKEEELINAIKNKADHVEVIITGRYASEALIDMADLVTEMKEIKHYYSKGVLSREGIDC